MFDFFPIRMAKDTSASNLTRELVSNGVQVSLKINFWYILNLIIQTAAEHLKKICYCSEFSKYVTIGTHIRT